MTSSLPRRGLLIVAHPDDEILWFSSVLETMKTVVVCYLDYPPEPHLGDGRRKALAAHLLPNIHCLGLAESGSLDRADWAKPHLEADGLWLKDASTRRRYRRNGLWLRRQLPEWLAGHDAVFTHNPWGEYGHEDHVQLHSVVQDSCLETGLPLWVPSCCGPKARHLAERYHLAPETTRLRLPCDFELAKRIRRIYQHHDCWTWHDHWQWPSHETFLRAADLEPLPPGRIESGTPRPHLQWMDC